MFGQPRRRCREPAAEARALTTAVIGATGRVGGEIARGLIALGEAVIALVREPDGLHIRRTRLAPVRGRTSSSNSSDPLPGPPGFWSVHTGAGSAT
jgi:hypothetical protein